MPARALGGHPTTPSRHPGIPLTTPQTGTETLLEKLRRATIGRYDVYAELGSGGMATVFLALDLMLDRKVAIKVMSPALMSTPGAIERFRLEARTSAALSHPHIVPIYAIGDDPDLAYYVMKFIEGRALDSVLREEGAQSPAFVQAILSYVGGALHHAHQNGVVHRDVKPANIMLDRDGWTYVTDFGIAKRDDGHGLTQSGMIIGTPAYMCPEQFNGAVLTGAADQYALGVVAYEMLAGRTPYDGPSLGEVMRGHLLEPVPPVRLSRPEVPEALEACVTRMLAKDPKDRFADLSQAVAAIGAVSPSVESEARTTIVRLARAADATRPSISVPQSPSPGTYRTSAARDASVARARASAGATVRTPSAQRMPPLAEIPNLDVSASRRPAPAEPKRGGWFFTLFVLLAVVVGVGAVTKRLADANKLPWFGATASPTTASATPEPPPADAGAGAVTGEPGAGLGPTGTPTAPPTVPPVVASASDAPPRPVTPVPAIDTLGAAEERDAGDANEGRGAAGDSRGRAGTRGAGAAAANRPAGAAREAFRERLETANERREAAGQPPVDVGMVRIGTTGPRYTLFVNGRARQVISGRGLHDVPLPAGSVQLSLRAINCVSWDTVVTVRSNQVQVIGARSPHC